MTIESVSFEPPVAGDNQVQATFVVAGHEPYTRGVNACFKPDGSFDPEATSARVDAVALGVDHKFALGVLPGPPPPEAPAPAEDEAAPEEAPAGDG